MATTKQRNLAAIITASRREDATPALTAARRATAARVAVANENLAAAKRIAKVSTREVAKAGSHAVLIVSASEFGRAGQRSLEGSVLDVNEQRH